MAQEVGSWGKGEGAGSGWGEGEGEEEGAGGRDEGDWGEGDGAGGMSTPKIGSSAGKQADEGIKWEREGRGNGQKNRSSCRQTRGDWGPEDFALRACHSGSCRIESCAWITEALPGSFPVECSGTVGTVLVLEQCGWRTWLLLPCDLPGA